MNLNYSLDTQLTQKLTLSPEMLQSLEIIQLPLIELKERIEKELIENPALELDESKNSKKDPEQDIDNIEKIFSEENNYFLDSSSAEINTGYSPNSSIIEQKKDFLEGTIAIKESLKDHLLWQLRVQNISEKELKIGEIIISLINPDGFFTCNIEEIFSSKEEQLIAQNVLELIQTFDPPGIASKDVKEALLFQLESYPKNKLNQIAYTIVNDYFDLMIERKDTQLAKILKVKIEDIKNAFDFLSQFNPYPGRNFSSNETKYIIPDVYIYRRDNELIIEINNDILPQLKVSKYMEKLANKIKKKKELNEQKKYVVEKVSQAKKFIYTIKHRTDSLYKLVLSIVKNQNEFFYKGPKYLKPLIMKQVAEEIDLSESTISRLASSKYIWTEWGIHEIKYFFTNSINRKGNISNNSSESVREMIKEIIESEKETKITDQKIVDILEKKGIKIARRTVAKYRKMLNILPSHHRNL